MRHDTLLFVLVPLYLTVIGALLIKDAKRVTVAERPPVANEVRAPVASEVKVPVANEDKTDLAPKVDESGGKRGLTPGCEKELRRTGDLLRLFANRIQMGEESQSVVADMRQQEKKISALCD
jgi:hypothetical protein